MKDDEIDINANDNVKWIPNIEESQALYEEFQTKFPIEKLKTLSLDEYNNTDKESSFCYWVETRLGKLGSIKGATSYKFGIYEYIQDPRDDSGYLYDEKYAWLSKFGKDRTEVYNNVLSNIVKIAECAKNGDFDGIEKIDISNMFKWKIAFLYSEYKFLNFYAEDGLRYLVKKYGMENSEKVTFADMYKFLLSKKQNNENIFIYASNIWNEWLVYKDEESKKRKYWSGGIYWGEEKKLEEFRQKNYWKIGWKKESDKKGAKQAWNNIKEIQNGDFLAFHGYGGQNDLTIYQISKVIDKDIDKGILYIEKLNTDDDILFHGKAPKLNKGRWFGTLFQITGEEAVEKIFGNYIGESQMQNEQEKLINETKTLLENTKNLILTGAPGTGKTFLAKQIAKAMGCEDNEIGFVQFHPSYDYTDFVEGLRPVQNDGSNQIVFERKDGVFKEFCAKALKNYMIIDEVIEDYFKQNKLFEVEGDKTTFNVSIEDDNLTIQSNEYRNHFDGTKEELVEYNKSLKDDKNAKLGDKKKIQELVYKKILTDIKQKKFVFIIDEINRGEVSKIFGELFYCIDPGYRGEKGRISTQYQNLVTSGEFQKGFFIPENVYIIGTMNDIDRSVESMDFAFRRRFAWKEITADNTQYMLDEVEKDGVIYGLPSEIVDEAKKRMNRLNNAISELPDFNSAYHIGASYFLKLKNYEGDTDNGFQSLWNYHLKGILEEYLRGNPEKTDLMKKLKAAYDGADVTNE
ncbi:MAG: AAA family ATPase [Treponemataceae bacterium]|nr:AAA family ATPase [Treponemataceae bacterium]